MVRCTRWIPAALLLAASLAAPMVLPAQRPKEPRHPLDTLSFALPELRVPETPMDAESLRDAAPSAKGADRFRALYGPQWRVTLDARRGVPSLVDGGAIPFLPGHASAVPWDVVGGGCTANACIPQALVEREARRFMGDHRDLFGVEPQDLVLDPAGTLPLGDSIYLLRFQWTYAGIPVEGGSVYFRINGGNLVQVATETVGPIALDPLPQFSRQTAWQILSGYLGPLADAPGRILDEGTLKIVPVTPRGMDPEVYQGPAGSRIGYRLVYRLLFEQDGVAGRWEALVDAHSGEIIAFRDTLLSGAVHGGVYPSDGHTGESDRPFAYADVGGGLYADAGGLFSGNSATVTLQGKYTRMSDQCGAILNTTTDGDADFGLGSGTDCSVPSPNEGGPGNTHAARTLYYHVTAVNQKARTYLPTNSWLNSSYINIVVNQAAYCNASSGGGTIYFYKSASGCWNLGEIPMVALHEWGHSMDSFDGSGGISPSGESRADLTAYMQTHDSCGGRGAFTGNCYGYGDACTSCTGIREADYMKHSSHTPWTPQNNNHNPPGYSCGSSSYAGPCGWEDHCESGIPTQAIWDFVNRDLLGAPTNLDLTTAWQLEDRLLYLGMPTQGTMYSCTGSSTKSSDGCNGGSLYNVMRAIDDDGDGTANGTPHAAAIFAALARHSIACGTAADATNQNYSSCPTLLAPVLAGAAGSNQAVLTWGVVAGAVRYAVYRNDTSCDAGFTRLGIVTAPETSYTDTSAVNGLPSYYRVQALATSDSCFSAMSNCATVTPLPCAGSVTFGYSVYGCADSLAIQLLDSDLMGAGTQAVSVWSTTESTPESVTLAETPAGSGTFQGTFPTYGGTAVHGDGKLSVSNGDTITVRYTDASYCGTPGVNVDATASADCQGPAISGVHITSLTDQAATVAWTTSEPANSRVTYGPSLPPSGTKEEATTFGTAHAITVAGLDPCTTYYYSVTSTDKAGNTTTDDQNGAYYTFTTPGRFFGFGPDHVEAGVGSWVATSSGGTLWHIDTCKAFSGTHAWKLGSSTCPGEYGSGVTADLTSPTVNLGNPGHGYRLRFAQWYSTEGGYDFAVPQISSDGGGTWVNLGSKLSGFSNGWQVSQFDLAAYSGPVKFRFHFTSDAATVAEGWYVDDVDVSHDDDCQGLPCILTCGATVPASALVTTPVSFQGSATATNCAGTPAYAWSFGDGATSTQKNPTHTYATAGNYAWTLTTTVEQQVCTKSGTLAIVLPCTLTCSATVKPDSGPAPLRVSFSASASATNCGQYTWAYYWDFGDGQTSGQKNTSHDYPAAGTYTWTLSAVYNGEVCTKTGRITVTAPCSVTCSATASPASGAAPLVVTFAGSAQATNCTGGTAYAWAFGDGGTSTQQNPAHTYAATGSYGWTMTATSGGVTCTETGTVTVNDPCAVSCDASAPTQGRAGDPISFTATSTATNCTGGTTYAWAFGDGGSSTLQNPTHTYAATGSYDWTLTATVNGKTCSKGGTIAVGEPCALTCEATATPTSGVVPLTVAFAGTATATNCDGTPAYAWTFGDGATSPLHNPAHRYEGAGTYTWTLTVTVAGKTCAKTGTITVEEPCTISCTSAASPTQGTLPLAVQFSASAEASHCVGAVSYSWDFGDGFTSAQQNPSHTYSTAGTFTWFLFVGADGQTCAKTGTITVAEPCSVTCEASAAPASGKAPLQVAFTGSAVATSCGEAPSYTWAFGDGTASNEQNPGHTYATPGTYTWTLTVTVGAKTCGRTGTVTVEPGLPGDANGDGVVSIGEVQQAINMFLGTQPPGNGVDCNGDGTVSIGEVQKVINAFLGLPSSC